MRFGKLMALALAGLMVLGGCAKENADPTFYNEGLSVIAAMAEQSGSDRWLGQFGANSVSLELVQAAAAGDYSAPDRVWRVETDFEKYPEITVAPDMRGQALIAILNMLHSKESPAVLAAASVTQVTRAVAIEGAKDAFMYIYSFPGGTPAVVAFNPGTGGAVELRGIFCLRDILDLTSAESLKTSLEATGISVTVTEVELPE